MSANPEFPDIDWIGPAAAGHGNYAHRYFVWHCTENPSSNAVGEANFAASRDDGIGTHFVADEDRVIQTLETWKAVGHVGSAVGNQRGIALEMCGTLTSPTAHYQAVIDRAIPAVRAACAKWGIPARWLTSAQANDGESKGWLTHDDARRFWGHTTHTDPGPNFPRKYAVDAFNGVTGASKGDDMLPDERLWLQQTADRVNAILRNIDSQTQTGTVGVKATETNALRIAVAAASAPVDVAALAAALAPLLPDNVTADDLATALETPAVRAVLVATSTEGSNIAEDS